MNDMLGNTFLPNLKPILQEGCVPCLQKLGELVGSLTKTIQQQFGHILRSDQLRSIGLDPTGTNSDLVYAIHQLGYQIKIEAGRAEGFDPPVGRMDDLSIL